MPGLNLSLPPSLCPCSLCGEPDGTNLARTITSGKTDMSQAGENGVKLRISKVRRTQEQLAASDLGRMARPLFRGDWHSFRFGRIPLTKSGDEFGVGAGGITLTRPRTVG